MELFNAEQSTTLCTSLRCHNASLAIDGDWYTFSSTDYDTGTHWLQVSMTWSNTPVYQIVLNAWTAPSEEITVSLYSGETLAGQCQSHSGSDGRKTLSCDRVTADRVELRLTNTKWTKLWIYEIKVKSILPGEIHIIV